MGNLKKGQLIIITGFSGAGKDTIKNKLLEVKKDFQKIITHTTRHPRDGEIHGEDLYFVDIPFFKRMISQNLLLEHVKYGTDYKGTSKKEFQKVLEGNNVIWRIDMGRTALVEETFREKFDSETSEFLISRTVKILIKTPTIEDAIERYKERESGKADLLEFKKRLKQDMDIFNSFQHKFTHIIDNEYNKADKTLKKILALI